MITGPGQSRATEASVLRSELSYARVPSVPGVLAIADEVVITSLRASVERGGCVLYMQTSYQV